MNQHYSDKNITTPPYYTTQLKQLTNAGDKCIGPSSFVENCSVSSTFGYKKPLDEVCPPENQNTSNVAPKDQCSSVWNNLTKRKSIV